MLSGADNPNGELPSYITGANTFGLKKERSQSPFDEIITHPFRCIIKVSGLKNGKLFDNYHAFYPRQRMEGANENTRVAQVPHRPGARQRRYRYQPEPGSLSRPAKPD